MDKAIGGAEAIRGGGCAIWGRASSRPSRLSFLPQADAGDPAAVRIRDRAIEHLAALIGVISDDATPLYAAGGLVAPLRAALSEKAAHPILEPKGDALTGCWLVASGRAPEERVVLFGETAEQIR